MQLQLSQQQYFKHELQSLNFHVIVHSQLPIYIFPNKAFILCFSLFQTYLPKQVDESMCISQVLSEYFRTSEAMTKFTILTEKNVTKFDILILLVIRFVTDDLTQKYVGWKSP